jgi:hypothetical protein
MLLFPIASMDVLFGCLKNMSFGMAGADRTRAKVFSKKHD